jgi:hypothetical protein
MRRTPHHEPSRAASSLATAIDRGCRINLSIIRASIGRGRPPCRLPPESPDPGTAPLVERFSAQSFPPLSVQRIFAALCNSLDQVEEPDGVHRAQSTDAGNGAVKPAQPSLKVTVSAETSASPEQVLPAAQDFCAHRAKKWPNVEAERIEVHERGNSWAEMTEGTVRPGRERMHKSSSASVSAHRRSVADDGARPELRLCGSAARGRRV